MKKVLYILSILVLGLTLVSCGDDEVDGAIAKLDTAYSSLNAIFSDPSNITENFVVPTGLANSVEASWASDEPGVVSFGAASGGYSTATVNRPEMGDGDATVNVTATLSLQSELTDDVLTKVWTIALTVKENTVVTITVESISDIFAITDASYDGTYQVELSDLTVFAGGDDAVFAYDGTGTIEVYGGAASDMEVGKVYTVSGTIDWYFGLWEITGSTAVEQTSATPQYPTKEVITGVDTYIDGLIADGGNGFSVIADGNFEPIYATVTGKVYMIPDDTSNYSTYVIDSAATTLTLGEAGSPADGFMVYYHTNDLAYLRLYNGIEVTMDVVIYTYRSNNNAFAVYYVGGADGITANLSDTQKQEIDANALSFPAALEVAETLVLPATGSNGSTIAWASSDAAVIDPTTGVVVLPATGAIDVTLTATVSFTGLADVVKTFKITVGELQTVTMESLLLLADGDLAYTEGEVLYISSNGKTAVLGDSTGYGYIYSSVALDVAVGDYVGMKFTVDVYSGLYEITNVELQDPEGTDPDLSPVAVAWNAASVDAFYELSAFGPQYVSMELVGYASGDYTNAYMVGIAPLYVQTNGATDAVRDKGFTATGWIVGRSSSKVTILGEYTDVRDLTDAEKLALANEVLSVPAANAEVVSNLSLSATGILGSTVIWTSSNEAVIAIDGTVVRPAVGAGNATVTLTYKVVVGDSETEVVSIEFTVLETPAVATLTTDLLITLYMEASTGNSKLIEIYNGTGADVDLSNYRLVSGNNGKSFEAETITAQYILALTGTLGDGEFAVIYHPETDPTIIAAYTANAKATIMIASPTSSDGSSICFFNGDDSMFLQKTTDSGTTWNHVDIIGVIGVDPGSAWTASNGVSTANMVLVRNNTVLSGVSVNPSAFDPSVEWTSTQVGQDITQICSFVPTAS